MKPMFILTMMIMAYPIGAQQLDPVKVKEYELQLHDVMEITDTSALKLKLKNAEYICKINPDEIASIRLGILYHEAALNFTFLSNSTHKGFAAKSYNILNDIFLLKNTSAEVMPFVSAYRASALSLMSAETKNLKMLGEAFRQFKHAVEMYGEISYCPEFMRGSVSENLPWFFFTKRKFAKRDFASIIEKYAGNKNFANPKIMSFTYWAWAHQHQSPRFREQALQYLNLAIKYDPDYQGGRKKAEELKKALLK